MANPNKEINKIKEIVHNRGILGGEIETEVIVLLINPEVKIKTEVLRIKTFINFVILKLLKDIQCQKRVKLRTRKKKVKSIQESTRISRKKIKAKGNTLHHLLPHPNHHHHTHQAQALRLHPDDNRKYYLSMSILLLPLIYFKLKNDFNKL